MTAPPLRPRRGGLNVAVAVDVVRDAWHSRAPVLLVLVLLTVAAVLVGSAGQASVPFLVYGGL